MLILRNTYFSSNTEEGYLLDQKEFNSKAQKELRSRVDIANGVRDSIPTLDENGFRRIKEAESKHWKNFGNKYYKKAEQAERRRVDIENRQFKILRNNNPGKGFEEELIRRRNMVDNLEDGYNKALLARENAEKSLKNVKSESIKASLKARGRQAQQDLSKLHSEYESFKRANRYESIKRAKLEKIKKNQPLLKKVTGSLKKLVKRFSQEESLEDIYKTILNPIILESDKVYGKKSLYIPRLLENGEIKEGKTLLIGQHPDADLKSDSCYEIFDGLWKDSSDKYWIEKSGFLGRKTWEEVEDPKKYMSGVYREFNISSGDLSKVCGNLSKAIYEDSLDNIKGNPQYWKLPKIKYF